MSTPGQIQVGRLQGLWRYPVKSMGGQPITETWVSPRGVFGDRAFALMDPSSRKIVTAKNPKRWRGLLNTVAEYVEAPVFDAPLPQVRFTLPGGQTLVSGGPEIEDGFSALVGAPLQLISSTPEAAVMESVGPDQDWLDATDSAFDFFLSPGTFHDFAPIHLVTTATLDQLASLSPSSRFDPARFRPNFLIDTEGLKGFLEQTWDERQLTVGEVVLRINACTPRCVMTILARGDLPDDPNVLRTAVRANNSDVGAYATVLRPGRVAVGDRVLLD